jgi:hypothetical protein
LAAVESAAKGPLSQVCVGGFLFLQALFDAQRSAARFGAPCRYS